MSMGLHKVLDNSLCHVITAPLTYVKCVTTQIDNISLQFFRLHYIRWFRSALSSVRPRPRPHSPSRNVSSLQLLDTMKFRTCVQKKNQLDATEWFNALITCSTCFGHFYAHQQELETICALLPHMVCSGFVAGCWGSGTGKPAMRSRWGSQSSNIPHSERIAGCPASDLQQPATKGSHTIGSNNTHIASSSWWWA